MTRGIFISLDCPNLKKQREIWEFSFFSSTSITVKMFLILCNNLTKLTENFGAILFCSHTALVPFL